MHMIRELQAVSVATPYHIYLLLTATAVPGDSFTLPCGETHAHGRVVGQTWK